MHDLFRIPSYRALEPYVIKIMINILNLWLGSREGLYTPPRDPNHKFNIFLDILKLW